MNKQPFVIIACCCILGILLQENLHFSAHFLWAFVSVILIILLVFLFGWIKKLLWKNVLICVFSLLMGIVLHFNNTLSKQNVEIPQKSIVTFEISKKLNSNTKYRKYEIECQAEKQFFKAIVFVPKTELELDFLHVYQAESFVNKVSSNVKNFQFDYAKYLHRQDIEHIVFLKNNIKIAKKNDISAADFIKQKRLEVLQNINSTKLSGKTQEFLKGIILADRTDMDAETVSDFNKSGLTHFLAISGTHMAVIFAMIYFLLIKICPLGYKNYVIIGSLSFIWFFGLFIGFGNSVLRSCIMLTIYFMYVLLQRKTDLLHALALSALVIIFIDSHQVFDVGFQMSFLAVLGIYWLNKPILTLFPIPKNWFTKILYSTISISVSAQLAVVPLMVLYFHQFSVMSILANFFIVPFSELVILFSLLMTVLIAFKIDFFIINTIYDVVISWLLKVISWFASFDSIFFENISMSWSEVILLLIFGYFLRFFILKRNSLNFTKILGVLLLLLVVRTGLNMYWFSKDEVMVHDFYKKKVLSIKEGDRAEFWIDESLEIGKVKSFLIQPYSASRRISEIQVHPLPKDAKQVVYHNQVYDIENE